MSRPTVSCVIPVYNAEPYIAEALDSVCRQSHPVLEIIVIDDGSTDGTADVVRRFPADVRYVRQENAGHAVARNVGQGMTRGDFVAFLDADDVWEPEKIARQLDAFRRRPELGYCVTMIQNFVEGADCVRRSLPPEHPKAKPLPGYCCSTVMIAQSAFEKVGLYDTAWRHADDTEWFLRAAERGVPGELLAEVLARRRMHDTNLSRLNADASHDDYALLIKRTLDRRRRGAAPAPSVPLNPQ
jgi:glycosyltransferase involved in cell wall biosynthesis